MTRMTQDEALRIQPGDVVYLRENQRHYVVAQVRQDAIAGPLFRLELIGNERPACHAGPIPVDQPDADHGQTSYHLCEGPHAGHPTRAPYRGGFRHSRRTLRDRGQRLHPTPDDPTRPDERYLDGPALRARRGALGLTQSRLAQALGVEANTIARWERGDLRIANPVMLGLALCALERSASPSALPPR